jgi:hypothetical protein
MALLLCLGLSLAGCRSKEDIPFLGRWEGDFTVAKVTGKTLVPLASRNNWKGYIILYRTADGELGNRCQIHMENEQEGFDATGHWKVQRRQIAVKFNKIVIDDAGGLDGRDPNKAYLEPIEIRQALSIPLSLNADAKAKLLQSSLVDFGPLEGAFRFEKTAMAH